MDVLNKKTRELACEIIENILPVHFFTIVLNGEPFIEYHINIFKQLPFKWHWHIVEGVADFRNDTIWCKNNGGSIKEEFHNNGLSNDGTTEYIYSLKKKFPDNITIYQKGNGSYWDGKLEMVNAPLKNINQECLLWQVDVDEFWTANQIEQVRDMYMRFPEKTAGYFRCHYFVGKNLVITTRDTFGNYTTYEWLRNWRYKPLDRWISHEPPVLKRYIGNEWKDLADINPLLHDETESKGLVFQHFAYVLKHQLKFKEDYYGYKDAVTQWTKLQTIASFPIKLREYFECRNYKFRTRIIS